jgi:Fatty acid hydroxylase superfamily
MLFLGAFGTPVALAVGLLLSANAGWLFAITGLLYFLNYEYLHLAYHLPEHHWVSRLPFMARLKRLHTLHHDQSQMAHRNFNITYPLGDWLFGTLRR